MTDHVDVLPEASRHPFIDQLQKAFRNNKLTGVGAVIFVLIILVAIAAPLLAPHDPLQQHIIARLKGPSAEYWFGTDAYGRDILSRLLYGARVSLVISLTAIGLAMVIGSIIGIIAGYFGGMIDLALMQVMDVLLAFPALILGLIVVAMLGPSMENLIIAIALTAIPPFARTARAPTIAVKERDYIEACRALGFGHPRIIVRHIFPNVLSEVLVMGSLWLATAIRVEASLSFIGLGVKPPTASWGGMIREGFENILDNVWLSVCPSMAILLVVFSLNLLGDGLRDAIDPKTRSDS
ncbi:peptide/nickel transport system permease protein [Hoeflea marina]|uniref:Peptide/nickel transport system permease protein n=1 Tax=Hoeflea marina TaxID=274592 RepID=A0A317PIZ2_9HYPH|nr:ABC transporter permease [Hoeflea marina]PWW00304.1 peptide/nickel transport system permease protein [Hoeflea marina]